MADSAVGFLLDNVKQLIEKEANLLLGVEDQVRSLRDELELMNSFLDDSDGKRKDHDLVKSSVSQIRDVAHEAGDVIDIFVADVLKQRRRSKTRKILHQIDHSMMLHNVAKKIESIKIRIKEIYDNRDKYDIKEKQSSHGDEQLAGSQSLHRRRRDVEEEDVVGFVAEANKLALQLIEGRERRDIVSIIGMGGLGKTTLARKIFNDVSVQDRFKCRAWVYVSNEYKIRDLLLRILKSVMASTVETEDLNDNELKEMLSRYLKQKRYLIVMDDVWTTELWDEVRTSFPDNNNGSRIMITSRVKEVALHASPNPPHFLRFLNEVESWELFSKKVFRGESCPSDLEDLGKQMAQNCDGLPLSIVVLGALLATKEQTYRTWSKMVDDVRSYLVEDVARCLDILALSYENLPRKLKSCFLYFGAFPEDMEISARQLIRLWIAEGFIQQIGNRKMENVAEDYLEELVDRSLIQIASKRADGGIKTCRIHDLLRDLCISESEREKFLDIHTGGEYPSSSKSRRLSIVCSFPSYVHSQPYFESSCIRTLLCFCDNASKYFTIKMKDKFVSTPSISYWNGAEKCDLYQYKRVESLPKGFKLVKVMDFGSKTTSCIPSKIGNFIHLRYMRLNAESNVSGIPVSICKLWNLQTLDLRESTETSLPSGIYRMQQLRHLFLVGPASLPDPDREDKNALENLQTLSTVASDRVTTTLIVNGRFPNLTKLGLWSQTEWSIKQLLKSLHYLHHLQKLKVINFCSFPETPRSFPSSLTKITLRKVHFVYRDIKILENLPNLRILKLVDGSCQNNSKECTVDGFPQLRFLKMVKFEVRGWTLREGAMQNLQHLVVNNCGSTLPDEIWRLASLRDVEVLWPSKILRRRVQGITRMDGCNLQIYPSL